MSVFTSVGRRPVLAGIAAATLASVLKPGVVRAQGTPRAQALDRAPGVLVFDVAESLLDLQALRPLFQRLFGDGAVVDEWFGQTILYSETATLTDTFTPFGPLGAGVLRMLGRIHGVPVTDADVAELGRGLGALPPHPDVPDSLRVLKAAGYRLVTLTDSPAIPSRGPLQAAGLAELFEQQLTAETVRRYKPARETYQMVAQATGVELSDLCMIAVHPWDLIGARAAGCSAALIARSGVAPFTVPGLPQPQIVAPTLTAIAAQLVALKHA
ncbi:haloacid dehalogenase type II [Inquilinus sp. CA228]|uniref:haloacid dehalogenase type II n=1 Tax=Inquilinus sp. CA228 TaxID=3455609 RepID=UPI003F8D1B67